MDFNVLKVMLHCKKFVMTVLFDAFAHCMQSGYRAYQVRNISKAVSYIMKTLLSVSPAYVKYILSILYCKHSLLMDLSAACIFPRDINKTLT